MLRFELMKSFKNKRTYLLAVFSALMALYIAIFPSSSSNNALFIDYNYQEDPNTLVYAFDRNGASYELQTEIGLKINKNLQDDKSQEIEDSLKNHKLTDEYFANNYKDMIIEYRKSMNAGKDVFYEYLSKFPKAMDATSKAQLKNIDLQNEKFDLIIKNNSNDPYHRVNFGGDNAVQKLFFSSNIIWGMVPLIFFVIFFSDYFSGECENGTYCLLITGGNSHRKIMAAKFLYIVLSLLLYILLSLGLAFIFMRLNGYPLKGFLDPYRLFSGLGPNYIMGWKLLLKSCVAFFLVIFCLISFEILISTFIGSKRAFALSCFILSLFYITKDSYISIINPLTKLNPFNSLLGYFELTTDAAGQTNQLLIKATPLLHYTYFLAIAILFFLLSLKKREMFPERQGKSFIKVKSLTGFEHKKILSFTPYKVYFLAFLVVFLSLLIKDINIDSGTIKENSPDSGINYDIYKEDLELAKSRLNSYIEGTEAQDQSKWSEKVKKIYEETLAYYNGEVEFAEMTLVNYQNYANSFIKDSPKDFYKKALIKYQNDPVNYNFGQLKTGQISQESEDINKQILEQAAEKSNEKMFMTWPYASAREECNSPGEREQVSSNVNFISHSSSYWLYKNIRQRNLGLIILVMVFLISTPAYSLEMDKNNKLQLMYTQPVSRVGFLFKKLFSGAINAFIIVIILWIIIALMGLIAGGPGAYSFPVVNYTETGFELMPMWLYFAKVLGSLFLGSVFLVSFMTFLSLLLKKRSLALGVGLAIIMLGISGSAYLPNPINNFNPFVFLKANILSDQSIGIISLSNLVKYHHGLLVLALATIINVALSFLFVKNQKEIL